MPLLILIVDDDPGICMAVKDYLELQGYAAMTAENGEAALNLLETFHPHLVVSDIRMPQLDGYELVRQLRQRPEFRLMPVVFLTERRATRERIQGYQTGCDVYLSKPFELEELLAVIRSLLERSQAVQAEWRFAAERERVSAFSSSRSPKNSHPLPSLSLTLREGEVLGLLATGLSNGEIGQQLHLSPRTIEKYVSSLLRKTETSNRAELVRFALDHQLID